MPKKNTKVSGYYFDGKKSYTLYEDERGNSTMEEQAAIVQQGYRENAEFKKKQIEQGDKR